MSALRRKFVRKYLPKQTVYIVTSLIIFVFCVQIVFYIWETNSYQKLASKINKYFGRDLFRIYNEIIRCSRNGSEYVEITKEGTVRYIRYPLDIDIPDLVDSYKKHGHMNNFVKPINVHKINFVIAPIKKCQENIFLLYAVKSAPANFENRRVIRETWGRENVSSRHTVRTIFLLGISRNLTLDKLVDEEVATHNDILKLKYYDSYYNNTYKAMGGLNWVVQYCKSTKFVIFGDDDFYFATKSMLMYLVNVSPNIYPAFFAGSIGNDIVERGEGGKWSLTYHQYPYFRYPPYLRAGAMIMSLEFAEKLQIASHFTQHLPFDDVFFGIVSCKLGIVPINQTQISIWWKADYNNITAFKDVIASHHFSDPQEIRKAWRVHEMLNP